MNSQSTEIKLPCCYKQAWDDGFGARGWKLEAGVSDPEVIASTAETGDQIPTSVFVHDIVDHALCGLGTSGHRNEAIALIQLASRTGADPTSDFAQMVDEDLLQGQVIGEPYRDFLPEEFAACLPAHIQSGRQIVRYLEKQLGRDDLRKRLVKHFADVGLAGSEAASCQFRSNGLDYERRAPLGLALQRLLESVDRWVRNRDLVSAFGSVLIGRTSCGIEVDLPTHWSRHIQY